MKYLKIAWEWIKKITLKIVGWIKYAYNKVADWLDNLLEPKPILKKEADLGRKNNGINLQRRKICRL